MRNAGIGECCWKDFDILDTKDYSGSLEVDGVAVVVVVELAVVIGIVGDSVITAGAEVSSFHPPSFVVVVVVGVDVDVVHFSWMAYGFVQLPDGVGSCLAPRSTHLLLLALNE